MRMPKKSLITLSFVTALIVSGCGGNSSSSSTTTDTKETTLTGVFSDAPVDGLRYSSATQSGYTQNGGQFLYQNGEMVQFYLGDVLLGESVGQDMVTPVDIVNGAVDTSNIRVQNILRLLQTCDNDGNPENGIMLRENAKMLHFANPVNLDSEADIEAIISNVDNSLVLVDSSTAIGHFQNQHGMMSGDQTQIQAQIHTPSTMPTATVTTDVTSNDDTLGASSTAVNGQVTDAVATTVNSQVTDIVEPTSTSTSNSTDTTATLNFNRATGELSNLGSAEVTITNLIVDFIGSYTISGMTIPFSGTYNYQEGTITSTTNGVSTTVPMTEEMKSLYPMTVKAGDVIPSGATEYDVGVSGATGQINYTYTFVTTSGSFVENATISIK